MIGVSNEYDELIFDYLEGNLSGNEKNTFEAQLSSDESLRAEVRAWKKSYVVESFPATATLEKQILAAAKKTRWYFSLNVFTAVLVLLFVPAQVKDMTMIQLQKSHLADNVLTLEHQDISSVCLEEKLANHRKKVKRHVPAPSKEAATTGELVKTDKWIIENETVVVPFPDISPLSAALHSTRIFTPVPAQLPVISRVKRFSWKETRAINRKKRRDYQKKIESKFLEGNAPYVVPLDVTNF